MSYLVLAPQGLGDSLEATPFIAALKAARPDTPIDVVVLRPSSRELFSGLAQYVRRVIYLPYWDRGPLVFLSSLLRACIGREYGATFLMYPAARPEYHVLTAAFRSRRRFAHAYWEPSFRTMLWLNDVLVPVERKHNVLRNLDLLDAAGIAHDVPDRYLVPHGWVARETAGERPVVIHVGSIAHDGLENKRWPLDRFAEVAKKLVQRGLPVTALVGPAERQETQSLQAAVPALRLFEGTLQEAARFLSSAAAVLSNDSGIAHLGAALGVPTLALFGPTPLEFAPYGPSARAFRPSPCPPCFDVRLLNTDCALNIDYRCLKQDLTVDAVVDQLDALLSERTLPSSRV